MVVMGRIVAPYGVLGWLKVIPDTELLDGLLDYPRWWIGKGEIWQEREIESAKIHNDVLVVKLKGVDDRDAAFACRGQQIAVPREALPEPEENEYYWSDLIGLSVKNQQNVNLGIVTNLLETGANDVLVVKAGKEDGNVERLLPFIDQVIVEVDIPGKTILVDWLAEWDAEE
jgi:16S rRNA processing protein RimM